MGHENHTPATSVRIPPDLKTAAMAAVKAEGRTLTDVIIKALERYVKSRQTTTAASRQQ
jgi:predicted HicB family RNase H-like nuclease